MAQDPRHRSNTAGPAEPALDPAGARWDTVGRILRRGRERERLNLRDVAEALRIRYDYLDAIERSEFDRLPGATYAIGFVRSYASYLDLDDQEIVRQFKQEVQGLNRTQDLSFPEPVNEGKVPGKALLLVSLVLVGAAYGGWHYLSQSPNRQISDMVPAVPDRLKAFLDDGGAGEQREGGDDATVTEFAEKREASDGGPTGDDARASEGGSEASEPEPADTVGTATTSPDGRQGEAATGSAASDTDASGTASTTTGAGSGETSTGGGSGDGAASAATASAPRLPDTKAPTTETAGAGDAGDATTVPSENAPSGNAASGAATSGERTGTDDAADVAVRDDGTRTSTPDAPAPSAGEDGDARETETASMPDTTEAGTASEPGGESGDRERSATTADGGSAGTAASAETPENGGGTTESVSDGIPEPPSPGGDGETGTADGTGATGTQQASLPEASGTGAGTASSGVNGAQADVVAEAKRVFGAENGGSRMLLRATQDSWVQVRGADDSPLLTRVLNAGDVYRVPDRDGLVLHTGNAGGLTVYIDGNPAGSLGQSGEVKRNVALSPDALR